MPPGPGARSSRRGIATRAANVETGLQSLSATLDSVSARVAALRSGVQAKADQVRLLITVGTLLLILGLVYSAFLHWVLLRTGSALRRQDAGA